MEHYLIANMNQRPFWPEVAATLLIIFKFSDPEQIDVKACQTSSVVKLQRRKHVFFFFL